MRYGAFGSGRLFDAEGNPDGARLQFRGDDGCSASGLGCECAVEGKIVNIEGRGKVTIQDLVTNALRMRPDRIIIGECRGAEALDMLQAMNTGHDGSLTTIHANTPRDSLARLETMVMMAG